MDNPFIERLQRKLREHGFDVWVDFREMSPDEEDELLKEKILTAIRQSRVFLPVFTERSLASEWVMLETQWAQEMQRDAGDEFRIISLIPGKAITPEQVEKFIGQAVTCLSVDNDAGGLQEAMAFILPALGRNAPPPEFPPALPPDEPAAELILHLSEARVEAHENDQRRGVARAKLTFRATPGDAEIPSDEFPFLIPLDRIVTEDLAWYLERFPRWPGEAFRHRAGMVEKQIPQWGRLLFDATLGHRAAEEVRRLWESRKKSTRSRFTVEMTPGASEAEAVNLLSLPWETMHGVDSFLFEGQTPTNLRRRLGNIDPLSAKLTHPPLRVLLVSPRPEDESSSYLDHRALTRPVVEALTSLGDLADFTLLTEPTFPAVLTALREAEKRWGEPYHVIHFDGHGAYSEEQSQGALCFEKPDQNERLTRRDSELIYADQLRASLSGSTIPLVVLNACQSGQGGVDPASSIAGALLNCGVRSVVAMSHTVLVETARRLVTAFYTALAQGETVGKAMRVARQSLALDKKRGHYLGAGELELHDWFVPQLYQQGEDHPLVQRLPTKTAQDLMQVRRETRLGHLEPPPEHHFVGRSRELLSIERRLQIRNHAVLLGEGGEGKTTVACEAARWLHDTRRVERVAFVCLENATTHAKAVLDEIGRQLVGKNYSAALYGEDLDQAMRPIRRELREYKTLIVLDNMETVLPPRPGGYLGYYDEEELGKLLTLFQQMEETGWTKLLFTSREVLPAPFDTDPISIGSMAPWEAVELVRNVLLGEGVTPFAEDVDDIADDKNKNDREVKKLLALVESVHCHARTLSLLAPELAKSSLPKTTEQLHALMQSLEEKYPNDRERSLYAGVALSLNRLSPETRKAIRPLGVFQGVGQTKIIQGMLGLSSRDDVLHIAEELKQCGLCINNVTYIKFHFALCSFLWNQLSNEEKNKFMYNWLVGEYALSMFLHDENFKHPKLLSAVVILDLPNLLAALVNAVDIFPAEVTVSWASVLSNVLQFKGKNTALEQISIIRNRLLGELENKWTHAHYLIKSGEIDHLGQFGRYVEARDVALNLLQICQIAGEDAYDGALFDLVSAHVTVARCHRQCGSPSNAIALLQEALQYNNKLKETGGRLSRQLAGIFKEFGDCYLMLEDYDNAVGFYEQSIQEYKEEGDARGVAVSTMNIGSIHLRQNRYGEALICFNDARRMFEEMNEPASLAIIYHQTGALYRSCNELNLAEESFRESLRIKTLLENNLGIANTLSELGRLLMLQMRWDEAVTQLRRAALIYKNLNQAASCYDLQYELGILLLNLGRLADARIELMQAIECGEQIGTDAKTWEAWILIAIIESAEGRVHAAQDILQKSRELYLQYRQNGGMPHAESGGHMCQHVFTMIRMGHASSTSSTIEKYYSDFELNEKLRSLFKILVAIIDGSRDPALSESPGLGVLSAVEVQFLLEQLNAAGL